MNSSVHTEQNGSDLCCLLPKSPPYPSNAKLLDKDDDVLALLGLSVEAVDGWIQDRSGEHGELPMSRDSALHWIKKNVNYAIMAQGNEWVKENREHILKHLNLYEHSLACPVSDISTDKPVPEEFGLTEDLIQSVKNNTPKYLSDLRALEESYMQPAEGWRQLILLLAGTPIWILLTSILATILGKTANSKGVAYVICIVSLIISYIITKVYIDELLLKYKIKLLKKKYRILEYEQNKLKYKQALEHYSPKQYNIKKPADMTNIVDNTADQSLSNVNRVRNILIAQGYSVHKSQYPATDFLATKDGRTIAYKTNNNSDPIHYKDIVALHNLSLNEWSLNGVVVVCMNGLTQNAVNFIKKKEIFIVGILTSRHLNFLELAAVPAPIKEAVLTGSVPWKDFELFERSFMSGKSSN